MISIIIPTYNEQEELPKLLQHLKLFGSNKVEIIVVDGGSTDNTKMVAQSYHVTFLCAPTKGRSVQMNYGALHASHQILYFVHADTIPPKDFLKEITDAIGAGFDLGRYCSVYQSNNLLLKLNSFFSIVDCLAGMGGDQTLFITKKLFNRCNGFDEKMKIMEEFDFCRRARKFGKYKIIKKSVSISARKYKSNSWFKVQKANYVVFKMYASGAKQEDLVATYRRMLTH